MLLLTDRGSLPLISTKVLTLPYRGVVQPFMIKFSPQSRGILFLIGFSLLNGVMGVFVKLSQGLASEQLVFLRGILAVIFISIFLIVRKKIHILKLQRKWLTLLVGISQGFSIWLYFIALMNTSVANAIFLTYTAPIFSVIFAHFLLKEKIQKSTLIGVFIAMLGILVMFNPAQLSISPEFMIGNIAALVGAAFYSLMGVLSKPLTNSAPGAYIVFWQYAVVSVLFFFISGGVSPDLVLINWWQLLYIGFIATGVAFLLFMEGIKYVQAQKIFVVTSLEPVAGTLAALLFLGEVPSLFGFLGACLILAGVFVVSKKEVASKVS